MFGKNQKQEPADLHFFNIFDTKVGCYQREPMLAINDHDMLRQLDGLMRDPSQEKNQYVTNAEDFQLFQVGSYWKKTSTLQGCEPRHIANLHEIKAAARAQKTGPSGLMGIAST